MTRETKMLAALLGVSGVLHFAIPKPYTAIVPKPLPYKRELVYASGVAELGCAAMLTRPRTRTLGGWLSLGLMLAVFPANVQMMITTVQSKKSPLWYKVGTVLRLPMQIPPLRWALKATRS
jgi:uncharacterized membrane protein